MAKVKLYTCSSGVRLYLWKFLGKEHSFLAWDEEELEEHNQNQDRLISEIDDFPFLIEEDEVGIGDMINNNIKVQFILDELSKENLKLRGFTDEDIEKLCKEADEQ